MHALLAHFVDRLATLDQHPVPVSVAQALVWLQDQAYPATPTIATLALGEGVLALAHRVDGDHANAYHNANHAAEATWAAATLLVAEHRRRHSLDLPSLPFEPALALMAAMVAHDLEHPGTHVERNDPLVGQVENHSAKQAQDVLRRCRVSASMVALVGDLIEQTEAHYAVRAARAHWQSNPSDTTMLAVLAGEADVLASAMPEIGLACGERLAQEWETQDPLLAQRLRTEAGRHKFLRSVVWVSPAAQAMGLRTLVEQQLGEHEG